MLAIASIKVNILHLRKGDHTICMYMFHNFYRGWVGGVGGWEGWVGGRGWDGWWKRAGRVIPYGGFCLQGPISANHQFLCPAVIWGVSAIIISTNPFIHVIA